MREQRNLLLGQNVSARHPHGFRRLRAVLVVTAPVVLILGPFWLGTQFPAHAAPPWPPAHVKLVPPVPERPQESVVAYVSTDDRFVLQVVWEPVTGQRRFLGVEPTRDPNSCIIHVAAEAPPAEQVKAVQGGAAVCLRRDE